MTFFAAEVGGIGGSEGGGIEGKPPGIVELESSSSGDKSSLGGDGGGVVVREGNAGVGGIMNCNGELCAGETDGEYIGETAVGDGVEILEGEGVLGVWNSLSSVGDIFTGEIFFVGDEGVALGFFLIGGENCFGDLRGEDLRGDFEILAAFGRVNGEGLGLTDVSLARGEKGLTSFNCFCLGGDFFVTGGNGGGGAALRAGIVIGDGTLLTGNSVGGEGDASFSGSLIKTGGFSSSSSTSCSLFTTVSPVIAV